MLIINFPHFNNLQINSNFNTSNVNNQLLTWHTFVCIHLYFNTSNVNNQHIQNLKDEAARKLFQYIKC